MEKLIQFKEALLGYRGNPVLPPVSLHIEKGGFTGIVGPNGAGKTTILKAILGIIAPISGRIEKIPGLKFGYVPQREALDTIYPFSCREVVAMARNAGLPPWKKPGAKDNEAVEKALKEAGIADLGQIPYRELSGGQKQRTLIARALATEPEILVLDEPTNGMDIIAEKSIMEIVDSLSGKGLTIVMVTHLLNLVANRAKTLILLNREIHWGPSDELLTEESLLRTYGERIRVHMDENRRRTLQAC